MNQVVTGESCTRRRARDEVVSRPCLALLATFTWFAAVLTACTRYGYQDAQGACAGITCSGHGRCLASAGAQPSCECDPGFEQQGGRHCVPRDETGPEVDGSGASVDSDGDGVFDGQDRCPGHDDGKDQDSDGVADGCDLCPIDPRKSEPGGCGCGVPDEDGDNDGVPDCVDGCPRDPDKVARGVCDCGRADVDSDGDTVPDCIDDCAATADRDGDGAADCAETCPDDPLKQLPGTCGCGVPDVDPDGDGTASCLDQCPDDAQKLSPGQCGCGVADADGDGDGTLNCLDGCPSDPTKVAAGTCGCGTPDTDSDGDGLLNCLDPCAGDNKFGDEDNDGLCYCAEISALADNFDDGTVGSGWSFSFAGAGASFGESGGRAAARPAPNTANSFAGFMAGQVDAITGNATWIEVVQPASQAVNTQTFFYLHRSDDDYFGLRLSQNSLSVLNVVGGASTQVAAAPYSAATHRHWRIREGGGQLHAETSADGQSWASLASSAVSWNMGRIYFGAGAIQAVAAPGTALFDHLNVGRGLPSSRSGTRVACPVRELTDNFDDNTKTDLWISWVNSPMTLAERNQRLELTLAPNTSNARFGGYVTTRAYDLTSSRVSVEVPQTPNSGTDAQQMLEVQGGGRKLQTLVQRGRLVFSYTAADLSQAEAGSVAYSASAHRFWGLRHAAGSIYWETSPDARAWTVRASLAAPMPVSSVDVLLQAGTYKRETSPGAAFFDNYNLP